MAVERERGRESMPYVLAINGSPRKCGNTDILIDRVLEGAGAVGAKTEKVVLNDLVFSPCQECENTTDDGLCLIQDDMQPLYAKIKEADVLVLGSPIFFGSLSAQMKMMIDRFQCVWRAKYVLNKDVPGKSSNRKGYFLCVEASERKDFFHNAKAIVRNFFATIDMDYTGELFCSGVGEKGSIKSHPDIMKKAFELGKSVM